MLQWILGKENVMVKTFCIPHRVGQAAGIFEYGNKFQDGPSDHTV